MTRASITALRLLMIGTLGTDRPHLVHAMMTVGTVVTTRLELVGGVEVVVPSHIGLEKIDGIVQMMGEFVSGLGLQMTPIEKEVGAGVLIVAPAMSITMANGAEAGALEVPMGSAHGITLPHLRLQDRLQMTHTVPKPPAKQPRPMKTGLLVWQP